MLVRLKAFVSHNDDDRGLAIAVREALAIWGIECFLAHADIPGGVDFEERIYREVRSSHLFIPVVTPIYRQSVWTDQEIGIALGCEKPILPASDGHTPPHGFIRSINARPIGADRQAFAEDLATAIRAMRGELPERFGDSLILELKTAERFDRADKLAGAIGVRGELTNWQREGIIQAALINNQIYGVYKGGTIWRSHAAWKLATSTFEIAKSNLPQSMQAAFAMMLSWAAENGTSSISPGTWGDGS